MKIKYQLNDNGLKAALKEARDLLEEGMQARGARDKDSALFGTYCVLRVIDCLIELSFENTDERGDT